METKVEKSESGISAEKQIQKFQTNILLLFSGTIILLTVFLTSFILQRSENAMRENVSRLVAANSKQLQLNINSYLEKMETTATLLFADESYYLYDETNPKLDEYDKIKSEEAIMNRIVDLGLMNNFSDFFIVYSDDHTVGWLSKGTAALFVDQEMYREFESRLAESEKNNGWSWGIGGNVDRIFYTKRLNENALLVSSIYNRELDKVFKQPEELQALTIRMINAEDQIMFSSEKDEIGTVLQEDIAVVIQDNSNVSVMNQIYLIDVNECDNGWRVVCSIPAAVILEENENLKGIAVMFAVVFTCFVVLIDLLMIRRVSHRMDGMMTNLARKAAYDQLSGVLNKDSFQEKSSYKMNKRRKDKTAIFVMLDMDNFKQINDLGGHSLGDEVIQRIGLVLDRSWGGKAVIGRIGGDEFAVYRELITADGDKKTVRIEKEAEKLLDEFSQEFVEENKLYKTSVSMGIYILDAEDNSFEEVYQKADAALYQSKRNGKNQFTIFQEGMSLDEDTEV